MDIRKWFKSDNESKGIIFFKKNTVSKPINLTKNTINNQTKHKIYCVFTDGSSFNNHLHESKRKK